MTEQGQSTRVSRRTIAKGAAWAVPVVPLVVATPAYAQTYCTPVFTPTADSRKCCNGAIKNMKLVLRITDPNNCVATGDEVCIQYILPDTPGGSVATTTFVPAGDNCAPVNGTITVFLQDVSNCTVNLIVGYKINNTGPTLTTFFKSDNIPSGNTEGECVPAPA